MKQDNLILLDNEINTNIEPFEMKRIINFVPEQKYHGEIIGKIISSRAFVNHDTNITDLIDEWSKMKEINSICVLKKGKTEGIIIKQDLFDIAGKPYGRDILKHKTVDKILKTAETFNYESSIFTIAEIISTNLKNKNDIHYILVDHLNNYKGIFTNRDLVNYLSDITQKDILLARNLQRSIVKEETFFENNNFSIIGASKMAKGVGGDFYYISKINENKWFITLCDVSGKGISAALVTAIISGMFNIFDFNNDISILIKKLNNYIINTFEMEKFITGVFAIFNESTGEVILYDMGHSYVFLYKNSKLFKLKTSTDNRPLGLEENIEPVFNKINLEKDDLLIFITDGIVEQTNSYGEEYGEKRFSGVLNSNYKSPLNKIIMEVYDDIMNFKGSQTIHDDMTIISLKYKI